MTEQVRTVREASIAIEGVHGLIRLQLWVLGGVAALGLTAGTWLLSKTSSLSETAVRIETKLDAIEKSIDKLSQARSSNMGSVAPTLASPSPSAFKGWYGVQVKDPKEAAGFFATQHVEPNKAWIYLGDPDLTAKYLNSVGGSINPPK